ncbi:MAG: minor capsid protein [Synergistaceae bacterium]|jgi:hypothetical protein|nr:minor capsid protein [Synergistaceae bacterium]
MTLIEALARELRDAGLTAYALNSPDDRDAAVTVRAYMAEAVSVDQAVVGDVARVQYAARGGGYEDAESLAWDAYREVSRLQELASLIENYMPLHPLQPPTYLGTDEKKRHMFSFNAPYRRQGA